MSKIDVVNKLIAQVNEAQFLLPEFNRDFAVMHDVLDDLIKDIEHAEKTQKFNSQKSGC